MYFAWLINDFDWCHQHFLPTISSTWYTPVSNWSNKPQLSGDNCSYSCTGPNIRWSHTGWRMGGTWCPPVSTMLILSLSTLWSTLAIRIQTSSILCRFNWNSPLECRVVSQHNTMVGITQVQTLDSWQSKRNYIPLEFSKVCYECTFLCSIWWQLQSMKCICPVQVCQEFVTSD